MKLLLLSALVLVPVVAQKPHELCNACHQSQVADMQSHIHLGKGVNCDACHGASTKHRESTGNVPPDRVAAPDEVPALCGTCHTPQHQDYSNSKHGELVAARAKVRSANCATCHGVHAPRKGAAIQTACARCHASPPPVCNRQAACASCHAPHLFVAKAR